MVYVIMDPAGPQDKHSYRAKGIVFTSAALAAATSAGALLGEVGGRLPSAERGAAATVFALAGAVLALGELGGWRVPVVQNNRETPRSWMRHGSLAGASLNGFALGLGAVTRIGFWLWYVVPIGAFFSGNALRGALIYGLYGLIRDLGPWMVIASVKRGHFASARLTFPDVADRLIGVSRSLRTVSSAGLLVVSAAALVQLAS